MRFILTICLLSCCLSSHAQMWDAKYNHLKKYMGINIIGGYAQQSFKHESINRFVTSFNSVFASSLSTQLVMPKQFQGKVVGVELSGAALRIGYTRRLDDPMRFEAQYTNGSIRKMEIEAPKNIGFMDMLLPIAKGRVFAGMSVGCDFGYFRLKSYLHNNFGRDTYANGDGVSGVFRSHLDVNTRYGGRLDINLVKL